VKHPYLMAWCLILAGCTVAGRAAEYRLASPNGNLAVVVADDGGLDYRVEVGGRTVLMKSRLGLAFKNGASLGPAVVITKTETSRHEGQWENRFGQRRLVPDNWRQLCLTLDEPGEPGRTFGLIVRVFDNGIAFRYDLPVESGLGDFVLTDELTEFHFAEDYRCWVGDESGSAEIAYSAKTLSAIKAEQRGHAFRGVLPLLVETPVGFVAVAESDLLDWSGMAITGTGSSTVKVTLCRRGDGNGLVVSPVPRVSPWRVLVIARKAADLVDSDVIATLATPCRLDFLRHLPTVWEETRVLQGEVAQSIVMARRSGDRWYLAAMNGDDAKRLKAPLAFLDAGAWTLRRFADDTESDDYGAVLESRGTVDAQTALSLSLKPAGGFAAILSWD
jgi:alpha-glucosidase